MQLDLLVKCLNDRWKSVSPSGPAEEAAHEVLWTLIQVLEDYQTEIKIQAQATPTYSVASIEDVLT